MNLISNRFARFRAAALASLLAPGALLAQAPADTPAPVTTLSQDDIEEIIVTGSRIARPELTAMSPFAVLGEEQIQLSNPVNIENFLRYSPQFVQAIGSNANNGNDGSATVDLRNLGESRTLVLVNGKRFVPYDYQGFVDVSMIPVSLIERVEVITGGASAVYGSEAVAGVVNFILKDKFEGLEVNGSYGVTEEGDGDTYDISATAGGNFGGGRGNVVFNFGYSKMDPITQGDRPYAFESVSAADLSPEGSFTTDYGVIFYPEIPGDPNVGCVGFDPSGDPDANLCAANFNFNPYNLYQVPQEKWTSTALASYEINEDLEFFARGSFANNRVDTIIAPTGTFFEPFQVNIDNPLLTPAYQALLQTIENYEISQGDPADGLANISFGRRLVELGTRDSLYENTAYQFVAGLRGTLLEDQDWEIFGQYGRTSRAQNFLNDNNKALVQESLLSDDGVTCRAPASPSCVPGNYFGAGNLDPAVANFIRMNLVETNKTDQMVFGGSLSGDLPFTLPTAADNALSYAAGVEFRREKGQNRPDDNYEKGLAPGFGSSSTVDAEIQISEVFAELLVPLVSDVRFAESINFETGIRYAQYENIVNTASGQSDNTFYNTSYKFGGDWSPVEDVRFSLMYQRAVRAPTLREIGLPKTPGTGDLGNDPCDNVGAPSDPNLIALCEATGVPAGQVGAFTSIIAGQIGAFLGGNPELEPEEADTWTAGVDWTPAFLEGLSVSVDWFDIEIDDAITQLLEQDIVDACYFVEQNASGEFCQLIERSPLTGSLNAGSTVGVFRAFVNSASESVRGMDFDIRYAFDIGAAGSLDLRMAATWVDERKSKPATFLDEYDCSGLVGNTCLRPGPEWTFIQTTTWTTGPATLRLTWRYVDSITQDCMVLNPWHPVANPNGCTSLETATPFLNDADPDNDPTPFAVPHIASQSYFDLTGTYDFNETWQLRAGVNNLFDRDPPIVGGDYGGTTENSGNTFPQTYPSLGRGYFVGMNAKF